MPQRKASCKRSGYACFMLGEPELPDLSEADGRFTLRDRKGVLHVLPGVNGLSMMEILRAADFEIAATCGGAAACGTCHLYVAAEDLARLAPSNEAERWQIDHLVNARATSRLACQILWQQGAHDGLSLELAPLE